MYKVLLVDDEWIALEAMKSGVCWEKIQVSEIYVATNITDAWKVLNEEIIDVMVCDIEMPNGNGLELVEQIVKHEMSTISIFLTCHSDFIYAKKAVSLGAMDYLLKPVDYQELEDIIIKAIQKRKRLVANERAREMLADVSQNAMPEDEDVDKNERIVESVKHYIKENIGSETLSVTDVASHVFLNADYLSRLFKKSTGRTIKEYILKIRMDIACELLVKTNLSVSKIAISCGYSHMAHFSKMFKQELQMTPNEYRVKYK